VRKTISVIMLSLVLILSACSSNTGAKDERTLQTFVDAFTDAGLEFETDDLPYAKIIGAADGVIFYLENTPVKLFEFSSSKEMEKVIKENDLSDFQTNGRFAIDTNKEDAIKIFTEVK